MISRRQFMASVPGVVSGIGAGHCEPADRAGESLGQAAAKAGLLYGASVSKEVFDEPAYAELYRRETTILTTDVAFKFDWMRPSEDEFFFDYADSMCKWAEDNHKPLRAHTLIWNDNCPDWLKRLSGREVERVFDKHIETVVSRYAGRLHSWDVVNEPFWPMDGKPGGWRDGPWYAAMGPSYVERAFRRVASIDKVARLTLNEAQCDNNHEWGRSIRPPLRNLVNDLLTADVPLHAVGLQSHLQPQWPSDYTAFGDYIAGFALSGLDIYLTEFDVNDESFPADVEARDSAVAKSTRDFLDASLSIPAVKMVVNWQLSDRFSWYVDVARKKNWFSRRSPRPLPFDENYRRKPMRDAMLASFARRAGSDVTSQKPVAPDGTKPAGSAKKNAK